MSFQARKLSPIVLSVIFLLSLLACTGGGGVGNANNANDNAGAGDNDNPNLGDDPGAVLDGLGVGQAAVDDATVVNVTAANPAPGEVGVVAFTAAASGTGLVNVNLTTTGNTTFQIVSQLPFIPMFTRGLLDPAEILLLSQADNPVLTFAVLRDVGVNSLTYPTRGDDAGLQDGTYQQILEVSSRDEYRGTVLSKNDPNPNLGTLQVNLFLVGQEAQRRTTELAIDQAIIVWRQIYGQIGVTLDIAKFDVTSDFGVVPSPLGPGSGLFLEEAAGPLVRLHGLNMFVGDTISNDNSEVPGNEALGVLGISSSIPGPAFPTRKTAVVISLTTHAGADGVLSDDNIRVLGETMAHEGGHYLGLFHPVEQGGDGTFGDDDPLRDTPVCVTQAECIANGLAANNMFPVTVGGVPRQQALTPDQGAVVNLQILVR